MKLMISYDGYNWNKEAAFELPMAMDSAGAVLYDDRINVIFGVAKLRNMEQHY